MRGAGNREIMAIGRFLVALLGSLDITVLAIFIRIEDDYVIGSVVILLAELLVLRDNDQGVLVLALPTLPIAPKVASSFSS